MPLTYYLWASPDCIPQDASGNFLPARSASLSDAGGTIFDFTWQTQF
jgi:hypothetical protein